MFPAPIGDKLLRLGSLEIMSENNVKNEEEENDILGHRIEYCCDLYTTIIQLTTSVYLSQLWNCVKNEKVAEKKFCQLNEKQPNKF